MRKIKFLFIFLILIAICGIIFMIKVISGNRTLDADKMEASSWGAKEELQKFRSDYEQMVFKNEILAKKNKALEEKTSRINKLAAELQNERDILDKKIENLAQDKKALEEKTEEISLTAREQMRLKEDEFKQELEVVISKYASRINAVEGKIAELKEKSGLINQKNELLENSIAQSIADAGRERLKYSHFQKGLYFEYNNRYEDAITEYKKILRLDPDDAETCLQLAGIYTYNMNDIEKAEFYARKYAKIKYIESEMPDDSRDILEADVDNLPAPFLKEKLQDIAFANINLENRIANTRELLKQKQKEVNHLNKIAEKKEALESELSEMKKTFEKETLRFHYNMALIFDRNKDYVNAVNEYKEALKVFPDDADTHYNIAIIYDDHLNDKKKAIEHYKRYLQLRPDCPEAEKIEYWIARGQKDFEIENKVFFSRK